MIEVRSVSKYYGKGQNRLKALDGVSFKVEEGTTVAIIGKSGSGKSTLMHIMGGLEKADSGQVLIGGRDIQNLSDKEADGFRANQMGFIFQAFFVEANQTAYQNVSLPLEIAGVRSKDRPALIKKALKNVELTDKIGQPAGNLSGGQKQRLAIARAIVNQPNILFADEPTGNLDSATGDKVMKLLMDFSLKAGATLFLVTHDEELASKCQMQLKLHDGKLEVTSKKAVKK